MSRGIYVWSASSPIMSSVPPRVTTHHARTSSILFENLLFMRYYIWHNILFIRQWFPQSLVCLLISVNKWTELINNWIKICNVKTSINIRKEVFIYEWSTSERSFGWKICSLETIRFKMRHRTGFFVIADCFKFSCFFI